MQNTTDEIQYEQKNCFILKDVKRIENTCDMHCTPVDGYAKITKLFFKKKIYFDWVRIYGDMKIKLS